MKPKDIQNGDYSQWAQEVQAIKPVEIITNIVKEEDYGISECSSCNVNFLQWTYKPPNRTQEEIVKRNNTIRTKNQGNRNPWFHLTNNANCTYNLVLSQIQFDAAGIYICWENMIEITVTNIIVVSE